MRMNPIWLCLLLALYSSTSVSATPLEYVVDLESGIPRFGHPLFVAGTITADTETNQLVSSHLTFTHDGTDIGLLPAIPTISPHTIWIVTSTELWVSTSRHDNTEQELVIWSSPVAPSGYWGGEYRIRLDRKPDGILELQHYLKWRHGDPLEREDFLVAFPYAPGLIYPDGLILVGTRSVPEPSSYVLLIAGLAGFASVWWPRRRTTLA